MSSRQPGPHSEDLSQNKTPGVGKMAQSEEYVLFLLRTQIQVREHTTGGPLLLSVTLMGLYPCTDTLTHIIINKNKSLTKWANTKTVLAWVWYYEPILPAPREWRQEDPKFKASLHYLIISYLKQITTKSKNKLKKKKRPFHIKDPGNNDVKQGVGCFCHKKLASEVFWFCCFCKASMGVRSGGWGYRDDSLVKDTYCPCRGPEFYS